MEFSIIYYITKLIVNVIFKLKNHSGRSGFSFDLTINKLIVKIRFKRFK